MKRDCLVYRPAELAAAIGVTTRTLRRWRRAGVGPGWFQQRRSVFYPLDSVGLWLDLAESDAPPDQPKAKQSKRGSS